MAARRSASRCRLEALVAEARACTVCKHDLPLGPRPTLRVPYEARLLIIGQAPGTRVHESGIVWDDASGDHLREWLGVDRETFYGSERIGVLPMGLCYPGKKNGGDAPPRPECAPLWHARILDSLDDVRLTLLLGRYAHRAYLPNAPRSGSETVRLFRDYLPELLPLPHPSWRSRIWIRENPFFERELLPELRESVQKLLG
jgi:uracil-DNA glycosylase